MNRSGHLPCNYRLYVEQLVFSYTESTEHVATKPAQFYIKFERIHPFIRGGGRTGYLLI